MRELGVAITDVRTAVSVLENEWAAEPRADREKVLPAGRVEAVLEAAPEAATTADGVRVAALSIFNTLEAAGSTTFGTVEVIRGHVTTAAVRGQADIATLPEILRSAVQGGYKDIFGALAEEQAAKAKAKAEEGKKKGEEAKEAPMLPNAESLIFQGRRTKVRVPLDEVVRSLTRLVTALDRVQQAVADTNIGNVGTAVGQCVHPVAAVSVRRPSPIVISPSAIVEITQGKGASVIVTGGTVASPDDYTVETLWSADAKIDVTASVVGNGRKYMIAVAADTPVRVYYMIIRDIVGQSHAVRIEVKEKPKDKPAGPAGGGG